ncbi:MULTISPECIES: ABC-three component system middle component 2 [unclassified Methylophaga]|jgi:hypothetical protein|uniref:ABC-three component system middle component 2 n=1 Tax=unclassified Methylophaga TaxID=2629249 RepID=UPI000C5B197A|nr:MULTISPECIES: ABC-three component system middle component 2 [unclassified Methylophaga]MAL49171.1 threonine transporter RhtB [Methylophaga sp.]MAM27408.1 threonine transporter RhtB [Flavobacteriaceae bacterium]MBP24291.1 threonine transporter RhtB [Methylophaga sp.]HCC81239.1 threonine transporter RhtB [Methylophaga sp.]|tara:strand:- start:6555 stop:7049 length:495 start_codon:yes stop_codon:yes gene_type:complete
MAKINLFETLPFNSPFELGIRMVYMLSSMFPRGADLQKLLLLDYAAIYSGDFSGPVSLHTPVPYRSAEIYTRRTIVLSGLRLMATKNLVDIQLDDDGITYFAGINARAIVDSVESPYFSELVMRCNWVTSKYGSVDMIELTKIFHDLGCRWEAEMNEESKRIFE